MSILFIIVFLFGLFYLLHYHRNEEHIDLNDKKFLQYLIDHNDEKTLNEIQKKLLNVDKANILIDRFYETKDTNYLAYAIQSFVMNGYFYTIMIGVILIVLSVLLFILLHRVL